MSKQKYLEKKTYYLILPNFEATIFVIFAELLLEFYRVIYVNFFNNTYF